jgi:hypothetical protein
MAQRKGSDTRARPRENAGVSRRRFLKYSAGGAAALVVGAMIPGVSDNPVYAAIPVESLNFCIEDAVKHMVTDNAINPATCYFWLYKEKHLPAEVPGPLIFTTQGQTVIITITNELDEPHSFVIPGMFDSGPIPPGKAVTKSFSASKTGTFLYYDNLNPPVNRVMGLHGAFIVMPAKAVAGHKFTPYATPTPAVQSLFDDLGVKPWFPGLSWQQGDSRPDSFAQPFRQYIWVLHEASPVLFEEVGSLPPGVIFSAATFVDRFINDPFIATGTDNITTFNHKPQYFTVNGQSGHFSHNTPFIAPFLRVGEPCMIRILNAGLFSHCMHIHSNHQFVLSVNGVVQQSVQWVDVYPANPLDTVDWLNPFIRPPDVPNSLGIGRTDLSQPLPVDPTPVPEFGVVTLPDGTMVAGNTPAGVTTWPPIQELHMAIPKQGTMAGNVPIQGDLSPLCYPMHDHSEPTQTAQGGNYPLGLLAGMLFIGDRTLGPVVLNFPHRPQQFGPNFNTSPQPAAGPQPPFPEVMDGNV